MDVWSTHLLKSQKQPRFCSEEFDMFGRCESLSVSWGKIIISDSITCSAWKTVMWSLWMEAGKRAPPLYSNRIQYFFLFLISDTISVGCVLRRITFVDRLWYLNWMNGIWETNSIKAPPRCSPLYSVSIQYSFLFLVSDVMSVSFGLRRIING